ncbi:hypothetical protein BJ170DRAFT_105569 [Xylariales sp. AK1849]|nr:hypothetical protein BJ170DRAFT_105569 [Xylariales sp. AK1849]
MVACKFRCPAGAEDQQGNYVPCKGEGFPDLVRLREHLTRVHCADGGRFNPNVKQLVKAQIVEWFNMWNEQEWPRAYGWSVIYNAVWPGNTETPPAFNASKEDLLITVANLTAADVRGIRMMAFHHQQELPEEVLNYAPMLVDRLHEYLQHTGGEPLPDPVGDAYDGASGFHPDDQYDVYNAQNNAQTPWLNLHHPNPAYF